MRTNAPNSNPHHSHSREQVINGRNETIMALSFGGKNNDTPRDDVNSAINNTALTQPTQPGADDDIDAKVTDDDTASDATSDLPVGVTAADVKRAAINKRRAMLIMPTIVLAIVSVIACVVLNMQRNSTTEALNDIRAKTSQASNRLAVAQAANNSDGVSVNKAATGYDGDRKAHDDMIAEKMFRELTTFNNADEYAKVRQKFIDEYHIDDHGQFLTVFMPAPTKAITNAIKSGSLAISYRKMDSMPIGMDGNTYRYATFVTLGSNRGGGDATRDVLMTYSIDENGQIHDLTAAPLA